MKKRIIKMVERKGIEPFYYFSSRRWFNPLHPALAQARRAPFQLAVASACGMSASLPLVTTTAYQKSQEEVCRRRFQS